MSTPWISSKCTPSACVMRPAPHPKSSALPFSGKRTQASTWDRMPTASPTPVWKNSSTSQRFPFLRGSVMMAQNGSLDPKRCQFFWRERRLKLLLLGQLERRVIRFAVERFDFFHEVRAVVLIGVGEKPGLAFVVPVVRAQFLGGLEVRNSIAFVAGGHQVLAHLEIG